MHNNDCSLRLDVNKAWIDESWSNFLNDCKILFYSHPHIICGASYNEHVDFEGSTLIFTDWNDLSLTFEIPKNDDAGHSNLWSVPNNSETESFIKLVLATIRLASYHNGSLKLGISPELSAPFTLSKKFAKDSFPKIGSLDYDCIVIPEEPPEEPYLPF